VFFSINFARLTFAQGVPNPRVTNTSKKLDIINQASEIVVRDELKLTFSLSTVLVNTYWRT
jgi:hypothetical protein